MYIQRQTIGWKGRENGYRISLTKLSNKTGYNRSNIQDELKKLERARILTCVEKPTFTSTAKWKINDKPDTWETGVLVNRRTVGDKRTVSKDTTSTVPLNTTTTVPLQANPIKKEEKKHLKKEDTADADPRFQPLKEFFQEEFERTRGVKLDTNGSDYSALKALLKRQPELELGYLKDSARMFLESKKDFYQQQGKPLLYWASNINGFVPRKFDIEPLWS